MILLSSCNLEQGNCSSCPVFIPLKDSVKVMPPIIEVASLLNPLKFGIDKLGLILDSLKHKRIAIVGNQSSIVNNKHLVDTLLSLGINVVKVFSPEHGFRGDLDAGENVNNSIDMKTGIPLVSLYGNNKKPSDNDLTTIDIIIFDIQDVGVRFYTFLSTLHYVMEACAENNKKLIVLDRPNPNAHYIDGPILEIAYTSFVGLHPVPIVYGMTIGEYALMINGEGWLNNNIKCDLMVLPCENYSHETRFICSIPPSPNLKSELSISLYPSLCLFEATTVSVGRGTDTPFEIYGHPNFPSSTFSFIPVAKVGAKKPLHLGEKCFGYSFSTSQEFRMNKINLDFLIQARDNLLDSFVFIDQESFFNKLAGTASLKEQLYKGWSANQIRETWKPGLAQFKEIRKKYLLYN